MSRKEDKKERVIHTRISESLDNELRQRASGLGVSVSNLIRNILLSTFGLVEGVMGDGAGAARAAKSRPGRASRGQDGAAEVIGWQELVLNLNAVCARCNAILPRGTGAAIGITPSGIAAREILCVRCFARITGRGDAAP